MELVVDNTSASEVTERAMTWPDQAKALVIVDSASYERAAELLIGIKALRGEVDAAFDPIIGDANRAHKTACAQKRKAETPLLEAELIVKKSIGDYNAEQERRRQAEERRLQEEAQRIEETRRIDAAAALEREGHATSNDDLLAEAMEMVERPVVAPAVRVQTTVPKVAGIVHRENWSARVTSLTELIRFVAAHPEHQNLLQVNTTAVNALARAMKGNLKIAGLQAVNTPIVAAVSR